MRALTDAVILFALAVAVHSRSLRDALGRDQSPSEAQGRVILVVADGLRWQEVFRGADSVILFGKAGSDAARGRYWRTSAQERRAALMPFLWGTVAREGVLYGNRDRGGASRVTNDQWFSYPGYNEMLVGYPDPRINSNHVGPNPNRTVFEWLHRARGLHGRVAAVGMWSTFEDIFNARRSGIPVRHFGTDAATFEEARAALRRQKPVALFVGFGATDDLAHKGRYDSTLDAAHAIDGYVSSLWALVQSLPEYRGRTTMILAADHGRGRGEDWTDHGREVPGSDENWIAIIGPGASGGESRSSVTLSQVAATVAAAAGEDYRAAVRRAAPPLLTIRSR